MHSAQRRNRNECGKTAMKSILRSIDVAASVALITGLGSGISAFLASPTSANLKAALTDESGTGVALFAGSDLGTPASGNLSNCTNLPAAQLSGTTPLTSITAATAGQALRVNGAGTAIEGFHPPIDTSAGDTFTSTPSTKLTLALPSAGSYLVELRAAVFVETVTGTRTVTASVNCTNLTSMAVTAVVANSAPGAASRVTITSSGGTFSVSQASNQTGWIDAYGLVTVSAAASVTFDFSISGDTGNIRGGSFARATRSA